MNSVCRVAAGLIVFVCAVSVVSAPVPVLAMEQIGPGHQFKLPDPRFGDLDEMVERRMIRVLTCYSKTGYFLDGAHQRGVTYELMREFEKFINKKNGNPTIQIHVVMVPVPRGKLLEYLAQGRGDIAASNLTITSGRSKIVDFADPLASDVKEVVVTNRNETAPASLDDLAGREVHVRKSSSFYPHLRRLNKEFARRGLKRMRIRTVDENLETEDILEMVSADLLPMTVADNHVAEFWAEIHPELAVHGDVAINSGGKIAWAVRRDTPKLTAAINQFVKKHKKGTLSGNVLLQRYFQKNPWVRNSLGRTGMKRFRETLPLFRKYADKYDFDHLMMIAQGFQESRLNQSLVSSRGARGVMQLLPSTAADPAVGIRDISTLENNIHAGVKYLRHIREVYFDDPNVDDLNRTLFAFAAYNAGPNRIVRLRKKAAAMNLDPNVWFYNVERAVAKEVGRETVNYVRNIAKYYYAYRSRLDQFAQQGKTVAGQAGEESGRKSK